MRLKTLSLIVFLGSLFLFSCNQERRAEKMPASVSTYVYAYTSGVISKTAPIRVRFASAVVTEEEVGEAVDDRILDFTPSISGQAEWEDAQTLLFRPEGELSSGTAYVVRVDLQRVFDKLPAEAHSFEFDFRTRDQSYDVEITGLEAADIQDLSKQELDGYVRTADAAGDEAVEQMLEASQNGRALDIRWLHGGDGQRHDFTVLGIERTESDGSFELSWNGKPIGVSRRDARTIEVPGLGNFKVMSVKVNQGREQFIQLRFSDPLQESQNLEGLISLADQSGSLRFLIEGNQVRVYPSSRLMGEQRVRVSPGIRNINGFKMQSPSEWTLVFEDIEPQVRLVGSGVILPNSEGLILPFEAVSLRAVEVEVFKIYHNNILQFLQSNELSGSYRLREVGRVILRTEVDLSALNPGGTTSEWTRYALDLGALFDADNQAMYQIRIGFRPRHATYFCGEEDTETSDNLTVAEDFVGEDGEIPSMMDSWYGIEGYYDDYDWDHRDDPCQPAYYNSQRFVQRNVLASNLGLIAKGGGDNSYFVAVSDLRTARPVSGATVTFYDYQQQTLITAQTDGEGVARVELSRKPHFLVATQGGEKGYLRLEDGASISLSRFDIAGATPQKGLKGMLYGERGVWRPGDSVYLNFILEDKLDALPENYPITFELIDARGQQQEKRVVGENYNGVYPLHFRTGPDALTGNWIARVRAGGATFDRIIKIETVKPNRLKIDLDFGREILRASDEPVQATLQVDWLHGAPGSNLEAKVEAELRPGRTGFSTYGEYVFDDPARTFWSEPRMIFDGKTNEAGRATFPVDLLNNQNVPGRLTARFSTRAFEPTGEFSSDYFTMPYDPFDSYAGVSIPTNQYGDKRLDVEEPANLGFILVNTDGSPLANRQLEVGLYRVDWRWWWERNQGGLSQYNSANHYNAKERTTLRTNNQGEAQWNVSVDTWGRYLVRVCDPQTGHCSGDFFYAGYPWYDDDGDQRQAAAMLAFSADKEKYNVGETVQLSIPTGEEGRALITLENGTRVVESHWTNASAGENTFTFQTTAEMTPTIYAHVTLVQPHAEKQNDLPIRMYGVIPIAVEDPATHLSPQLQMPDELRPLESFTVEVSEASKKEMTYTLAVVDEGLLGLTRFQTPDPWNTFYAREALGVKTWDLYDEVLGAFGGAMERVLSIGGDGEIVRDGETNQANRFEPVVRHLGPFTLKRGQTAKHEITMPNYVGAVRTMVVASADGAYGNADKTVPVRKPLMVLATLPRVLGPGEQVKLPVNVFAMTPSVKNATIAVEETSGLARLTGAGSQQVDFAQPEDELVTFDFQMAENVGVARFKVTARGGGETASQEIEVQVRNPNPYQSEVYSQVLQAGESWTQGYAGIGMAGTNEAILEVSSLPPIDLGRRLNYLIQYPYGCLEQTLSGGFPQLYAAKLLDLNDQQKEDIPQNIEATINRLKQFQTATGGFAYWPGNSGPDHWSTSYAGHFLLEAKSLGYSVPENLLSRWASFQQKTARTWDPDYGDYSHRSRRSYELMQAYRLYTLALAQKPELGAMNRLRETPELSRVARWRLAAAYALTGRNEVARELVRNTSTEVDDYTEMGYTYGSGLRDRAMILETLTLMGEEEQAMELLMYIAEELSRERWLSTQTTAYALLAIGKLVGEQELGEDFSFSYQLAGQQSVNAGSNSPIMQIDLPADRAAKQLTVNNGSSGVLYARVILRGQPLTGEETDGSNDLRIAVAYRDMEGKPLSPERLPQGSDFIAEVKITHPGVRGIPYQEMALSQVFPAGWEIINSRMDGIERFRDMTTPEYRDIRDDRVNTFFDIREGETHTYRVQLNAAYLGRYYLPAVSCEAMYDRTVYARESGRWVEIVRPENM